jgi:hypothetical protein
MPVRKPAAFRADTTTPIHITKMWGAAGTAWSCACGHQLSSSSARVDVHCPCGRVYRKTDRSIHLFKEVAK